MNRLQKPLALQKGDTVAVISPSHGWAGDEGVRWKYVLGVRRLEEMGLHVTAAPHSLKGSSYLARHPEARAEDIMWAFENTEVKAVIANMGGNDSLRLIPYISRDSIRRNPKICIGYSDVMNLHLLCYHCGLSSFYGDNLLTTVAEAQGWHPYSRKWFEKVLFDPTPIGTVEPAAEWTWEDTDYTHPDYVRGYHPCEGYTLLQGQGVARGRLFGGHIGLMELQGTSLAVTAGDFEGAILFVEDIPEFFTPEALGRFMNWLGEMGALQKLKGIVIGRRNEPGGFEEHKESLLRVVRDAYGLGELPILYGLHFGHSSPICVLPYGAMAEINCEDASFTILESGTM